MQSISEHLTTVKRFATSTIANYPDRIVYHDVKFANRIIDFVEDISSKIDLNEDDKQHSLLAAWLVLASYGNIKINLANKAMTSQEKDAIAIAKAYFNEHPIAETSKNRILDAFGEMFLPNKPKSNIGMVVADALTADLILGNSKKNLKKMYEEVLLHNVLLSRKKWYDLAITVINQLEFHLPYCKEHMQPKKEGLILELEKEKKRLDKTKDLALKKELDISDSELKNLKKKLESSKGRDDKGIQTMFRTTIKNHYTLNEMVDRKASIMITVNSIILSLIIGGILGEVSDHGHLHINAANLPIIALTFTSIGSIIFAILSIRPFNTHGQFTEDEVRNKQGNLLYYGNFHNMALRDFEWGIMQMMNNQEYLYGAMIRDLYFLGQVLKKKYSHIRISLTIFLFGLIGTFIIFFISGFLNHH